MEHYNSNSLLNWDTEIEGEAHGYMDNETVALLLQEAHIDECVQTTTVKQGYETRKSEEQGLTEYNIYYDFGRVSIDACLSDKYIVGESVHSVLKYGGAQTKTDCLMVGEVSHTRGERLTFPKILMTLLYDQSHDQIISWIPHGRSFIVRDRDKFLDCVAQSYFNLSSFKSFTRNLNLWGFKRVEKGDERGSYYHQLFLRSKPMLVFRMAHLRTKDFYKQLKKPSIDPDFNALEMISPLGPKVKPCWRNGNEF